MASFTMTRRCLLASLLLVASDVTTTSTVQPFGKPDEGLLPYIIGLPVTISRALERIHQSTRSYRLMDDIWFEVKPENAGDDKKISALKSPPKNLVDQADAVFDTHRLTWHNAIVQGLDLNIYKDQMQRYTFDIIKQTRNSNDFHAQGTRTFGMHRRRLQLVMLPVMYKLGVITTLLIALTLLSVKGVTIGVLLLVLAVAGVVAKVSKSHHAAPYAAYAHDPYDRAGSPPLQLQQQQQQQLPSLEKNIHVHVHAAPGPASSWSSGAGATSLRGAYDGQATADDNAGGPYYWSRHGADYYDTAAATADDRRLGNRRLGLGDAAGSTAGSPYPWLGRSADRAGRP